MYLLYKDKSFVSYPDSPGPEYSVTRIKPVAIFSSKKNMDKYIKKHWKSNFSYLCLSRVPKDPI